MALLLVTGFILLSYAFLLLFLWRAWKRVPVFEAGALQNPVPISVIIAARNEEDELPHLLSALQNQEYPGSFEVIVVDDDSTDRTSSVAGQFPFVNLLSVKARGKKRSLAAGIGAATGELLVTTDADCRPGPYWLHTIQSFYLAKNTQAIAAPVLVEPGSSILSVFQCLDFMMLQGITAGTVHAGQLSMANGANFSYTRKAYQAVGGFHEMDRVASGDDMFMAYRVQQQFPGQYAFLLSRDAVVRTRPISSPGNFISQRKRWASKSFSYEDHRILPLLALVYLANLSIFILGITAILVPGWWTWLVLALLLKTLAEWPLMQGVAKFFGQQRLLVFFPLLQPLHILYSLMLGLLSLFPRYRWKGRSLK